MMQKDEHSDKERRKYIRLDTVFPVEFRLQSPDGKQFFSDWLQGFTNNVGKGGICLAINNLKPELAKYLKEKRAKIALAIEMPITKIPVKAEAIIIWSKELALESNRHLIGLSYEKINPLDNNKIMRYALTKKLFLPVSIGIILLLILGLVTNSAINIKLIKDNRRLVTQLVKAGEESSAAKQRIRKIIQDRESLQEEIKALEPRIQSLNEERQNLGKKSELQQMALSKKIAELGILMEKLNKEKIALGDKITGLAQQEARVSKEFQQLDEKRAYLTKVNFEKMYKWLAVHQNPRTGLVMSFEGDGDIANWAFIYDQALVVQAYAYFSDFARAKKILDFFKNKAKREKQLFFNAYYSNDGTPAEFIMHSGPNIWLGIAILQYNKRTHDPEFLDLAEEIAQGIVNLQDKEGGIRGGPNVEWYATEHNLDAHAFFNMLFKVTGKTYYQGLADKVLNWLLENTYAKIDVPIKRGKGDSTIATDTYAWSIAAIGPERLEALGMNPDSILEFAEKSCSTTVEFIRPEGNIVKIKGFDFAPSRHVARLGVVSSEWTAQMIMAFKIMADYHNKKGQKEKANLYEMKANEYMSDLSNMIISSPSPSGQGASCLPYATQDFVDTGHGWLSPKGKSTGSVAGTAYTLFAYYNYNPLELKD